MISSDQWINVPVGYNLYDHVGVSGSVQAPSGVQTTHIKEIRLILVIL